MISLPMNPALTLRGLLGAFREKTGRISAAKMVNLHQETESETAGTAARSRG
jgi:hypothetical protein